MRFWNAKRSDKQTDALVQRMLAKEPSARWPSLAAVETEIMAALVAHLAGSAGGAIGLPRPGVPTWMAGGRVVRPGL